MNHYIQIIILGIVEGVTEFLPISSTGHLLMAEGFLHIREPDVFNVVIQAGAILAVVFIYWHKIMDLLGSLDKAGARSYLFKLIAAFATTSVVSLVLIKHYHLHLAETLTPVAWATLIGGLVIFVIEFLAKNLYPHDDISWPEAILMGLAQVLAGVFPGTSRSGSTIMTGLAMGMKRPTATEFSFLLGIPTMFAASALDLWRYRKDLTTGGHQLVLDIVIGFIVSAIVAFFVVKWLLRFVQSHTFNGFALYRVLLGGGLLIAIALNPALAKIGDDTKEVLPAQAEIAPTSESAPAPVTQSAPAPASTPSTDASSISAPLAPTPTPDSTMNAGTASISTPADQSAPPRALPVVPADSTNAAPATNVTILPPPVTTNSAP